jgi:hypothetical protein
MAITATDFLADYPEFSGIDPNAVAIVTRTLAVAGNFLACDAFGPLHDYGLELLTAHRLACRYRISPPRTPAIITGGTITLTTVQAVTAGSLTIQAGVQPFTLTSLNFAACNSLADVVAYLNTVAGNGFQWVATATGINLTSAGTGNEQIATYATGTAAAALSLTSGTGAAVKQGSSMALASQTAPGVLASQSASGGSVSVSVAHSSAVESGQAWRADYARTSYGLEFLGLIDSGTAPMMMAGVAGPSGRASPVPPLVSTP